MMRSKLFALALAAPLALLAACGTDDYGQIYFQPDTYGLSGLASLDSTLIIGSETNVAIKVVQPHRDVAELTLTTDDANVVSIERAAPGTAVWKVTGLAEGDAHLIARAPDGDEIERATVHVGFIDGWDTYRETIDAQPAPARAGYDQVWDVDSTFGIYLHVRPTGAKGDVMGHFDYDVDLDPVLAAHQTPDRDGHTLAEGYLELRHLPEGEFPATFTASDGTQLKMLIVSTVDASASTR